MATPMRMENVCEGTIHSLLCWYNAKESYCKQGLFTNRNTVVMFLVIHTPENGSQFASLGALTIMII